MCHLNKIINEYLKVLFIIDDTSIYKTYVVKFVVCKPMSMPFSHPISSHLQVATS